jgi:guanine deaminase
MTEYENLMTEAIAACERGIEAGQSPFGAAIAKRSGELIFAAHNKVRLTCDPSAHAEITCIRGACEKLGTIDLSGCIMATTCEPCPMCAAAIHWARLDAVYFGATIADAEEAGFNELAFPCKRLYTEGGSNVEVTTDVCRNDCRNLFVLWKRGPNPAPY